MEAIQEMLIKEEKVEVPDEPGIPSKSEVATLNDIIERLSQVTYIYHSLNLWMLKYLIIQVFLCV